MSGSCEVLRIWQLLIIMCTHIIWGWGRRWQNSVPKSYIFKDASFFFNPFSRYLVFHVANEFFSYHLELRVGNSVNYPSFFHSDRASALSIKVMANGPSASACFLCKAVFAGWRVVYRFCDLRVREWDMTFVRGGGFVCCLPKGNKRNSSHPPSERLAVQTAMYLCLHRYGVPMLIARVGQWGLFQWQKEESPPFAEPAFPWQHPILPWVIYGLTTWSCHSAFFQSDLEGLPLAAEPRGRDSPNRNSKEISLEDITKHRK